MFHRLPERRTPCAGGQRRVDDVGSLHVLQPIRIERELEAGTDQDIRVVHEGGHGAVAVMDVEVEDGDAVDAGIIQGSGGGHGDAVEEAEPHRLGYLGVVSGRDARRRTRAFRHRPAPVRRPPQPRPPPYGQRGANPVPSRYPGRGGRGPPRGKVPQGCRGTIRHARVPGRFARLRGASCTSRSE